MKHRLLHDHSAAPQLLILCYLLDATGFWNRFFSREELASVRSRLPKMEHSLAGRILGLIDRMDCTSLPEYFCSF
ncbi:MAG: hypothetical protein PUC59_03050 [Firmicutes bacterium]|nr:hypothetical protein [Bacillota bacterium]